MMFFENLQMALLAIRANKARSLLTMLGMIIGISSVIAIMSLGDTIRNAFVIEFEALSMGKISTYIDDENETATERNSFLLQDEDELRAFLGEDICYVGYETSQRVDVTSGRQKDEVRIEGLAANPESYVYLDMIHGRMFSDHDIESRRHCIVIENRTATKLFGRENAVGETIRCTIMDELYDLTVVGVYQLHQSGFLRLLEGDNPTRYAYVPETLFIDEGTLYPYIAVVASDGVDTAELSEKLKSYFARQKGIEESMIFPTSTADDMKFMDDLLLALSAGMGAIAAISLLVGGIGIMNIMLVSVTERTREIGIRKALGAETSHVLMQFLVESAMISAVGGILGTAFGIGMVAIAAAFVDLPVVVRPSTVLLAVAFSALVGIGFGMYPAAKAAKADPIEALRYE